MILILQLFFPSHAFSKDGWYEIKKTSASIGNRTIRNYCWVLAHKFYRQRAHEKRHRERKWAIERFERMRNRVRKVQFSREGAAVASADAVGFRIEKT